MKHVIRIKDKIFGWWQTCFFIEGNNYALVIFGVFHWFAAEHTSNCPGAFSQEGTKAGEGINGDKALSAFCFLGAVSDDAIAEYHAKIQPVSYLACLYCFGVVCAHAGPNGKIYA